MSTRKAILCGGQATRKFAKASYNLGQNLGSFIAQAILLGAKGLAWLVSSLCVLVVAFTLYIVVSAKLKRIPNIMI